MENDVYLKTPRHLKGTPATLALRMENIQTSVKLLNAKINSLTAKRTELLQNYEELKQAKEEKERKIEIQHGCEWDKETFPWSVKVRAALKNVFHLNEFRSQQLQAINAVMARNDTLLIVPTGGGKSLCYQLPAVLASNALTIVISPLISLMEDQVWSLQKLNIEAELLSSTTDKSKNNTIIKQIAEADGPCPFRVLYVTPERLAKSKRFMNALQKCYLAKKLHMIAVDEVHCCSQWGHDFRPDYKFLGVLKSMFPDVPILGTTATATKQVISDVQKMLNLTNVVTLKAEFNRPNLYYHILDKPSDKEQCVELLADLLTTRFANQSGIIYAFSISDTEELASALVAKDLKVRPYHASLPNERRTKIHSNWLSGKIQAVVATVAFGMGIDKPDVRFVIHHTLSKSMENFYQESGRAGRDGKRAECILLYRCQDAARITSMMFTEHTGLQNAYHMLDFVNDGVTCRRTKLSKHFLDVWSPLVKCHRMCDRCFFNDVVYPPQMNVTEHCLTLYQIIEHASSLDVRLTFLKLVDAWYHKGKSNLRLKTSAVPNFERFHAERIIIFLILQNYLKEDFHFSTYTTISYIAKGGRMADPDEPITYCASRILDLPSRDAVEQNEKTRDQLERTPSEADHSRIDSRRRSTTNVSDDSTSSSSKQASSTPHETRDDRKRRPRSNVSDESKSSSSKRAPSPPHQSRNDSRRRSRSRESDVSTSRRPKREPPPPHQSRNDRRRRSRSNEKSDVSTSRRPKRAPSPTHQSRNDSRQRSRSNASDVSTSRSSKAVTSSTPSFGHDNSRSKSNDCGSNESSANDVVVLKAEPDAIRQRRPSRWDVGSESTPAQAPQNSFEACQAQTPTSTNPFRTESSERHRNERHTSSYSGSSSHSKRQRNDDDTRESKRSRSYSKPEPNHFRMKLEESSPQSLSSASNTSTSSNPFRSNSAERRNTSNREFKTVGNSGDLNNSKHSRDEVNRNPFRIEADEPSQENAFDSLHPNVSDTRQAKEEEEIKKSKKSKRHKEKRQKTDDCIMVIEKNEVIVID